MTIIMQNYNKMLTAAVDVDAICQPLRQLGIVYFGYVRVYNDGSMFDINNNAEFSEVYYCKTNCYQLYPIENDPLAYKDGFLYAAPMIEQIAEIREISDRYSAAKIMVLINKLKNYSELWHFGSSPEQHDMINTYLSHLDLLKTFCFYFKDKAASLINCFDQHRLFLGKSDIQSKEENLNSSNKNDPKLRQQLFEIIQPDKYYLGEEYDHAYLSKREVECLNWCLQGKTTEETGVILNIKKRTVDAHLDNIRQKLKCYKQSTLIHKALELGIIGKL